MTDSSKYFRTFENHFFLIHQRMIKSLRLYTLLSSISFSLMFGQLLRSHNSVSANDSYFFLHATGLILSKVILLTSFSYSKLSVVLHFLLNKLPSLCPRPPPSGFCLPLSAYFPLLPMLPSAWWTLTRVLHPRPVHPVCSPSASPQSPFYRTLPTQSPHFLDTFV